MAANYRVFTIDAGPADNIVNKIYEQLQKEGYNNPDFKLHFVGFEAKKGTQFKLNQNNMVVPTNGYFISPYEGEYYLNINELYMTNGCSQQNFYCIY